MVAHGTGTGAVAPERAFILGASDELIAAPDKDADELHPADHRLRTRTYLNIASATSRGPYAAPRLSCANVLITGRLN